MLTPCKKSIIYFTVCNRRVFGNYTATIYTPQSKQHNRPHSKTFYFVAIIYFTILRNLSYLCKYIRASVRGLLCRRLRPVIMFAWANMSYLFHEVENFCFSFHPVLQLVLVLFPSLMLLCYTLIINEHLINTGKNTAYRRE